MLLFPVFLLLSIVNATIYHADVIVYESTPSGIMASIAASNKTGLNVILISTTSHIGGVCSGGLGKTDIGNSSVIGGLALEFFIRNGAIYNKSIEWTLEPHIALNIFMEMMNESNVSIIIDSPILKSNINSSFHIIKSISTINGNEYIGKIYIDASYEGDLFGKSGVSYTVGRESNAQYNETINGRTIPKSLNDTGSSNNFVVYVNPYDDNGNLLPLVQPYDNETPGEGDNRLESMNYRLCITKDKNNRVPFTKPDSYKPENWELLRRMYSILPPNVNAMPTCRTESIPNGKYDMNNCGSISSDFINFSDMYINSTYEQRKIIQSHARNYTLELLWFLCSDLCIPDNVKNVMNNEWGFCKDEFIDNNYFPPQLYIREGRRMINYDFVFTENVAIYNKQYKFYEKNQSIGLGSYNFDAHNVQRFACKNASMCLSKPPSNLNNGCNDINNCAYAWNEGDVQVRPPQYEIPYMVLTPSKNEVNNLLVSVGVSSTHIGYASIRMEPNFMILGHSAGTAATILIKNNIDNVHDIDLGELKQTLLKQGQYLSYTNSTDSSF
eukprot:89456_1